MVHTQQFTPPQLLEAGHRAESDGRFDLANQFYRQLTEQYAYTAEAAEARNGLGRVGAAQSHIWHTNGNGRVNGATRPTRRRPVAPRDHYRTGRALARLLSGLGWMAVACGCMAPAIYVALEYFMPAAALPRPGVPAVLAGSLGGIVAGLLVVFSGQISRAVFDQANAMRDLVALERGKIGHD
jgi:hypothetical protein